MTYNDPSHLPETNPIDQAKVDALSKEISKWLQTKMYGIDVRTALAWAVEHFSAMHYDEKLVVEALKRSTDQFTRDVQNQVNQLSKTWNEQSANLTKQWTKNVGDLNNNWQNQLNRWNTIISGVTTDTEIVDARTDRNGHQYPTLAERLNASQSIDYATTQEAIEGRLDNKVISPFTFKEALPSIVPQPKKANELEALAGTDDEKMMTPLKVSRVLDDKHRYEFFFGTDTQWKALPPAEQQKYQYRAILEDGEGGTGNGVATASEYVDGIITKEMYKDLKQLISDWKLGKLGKGSNEVSFERIQ